MQKQLKHIAFYLILLAAILIFFGMLYKFDNKYTTPMSLPQENVLYLSNDSFAQSRLTFLIDDWQFVADEAAPQSFESGSSSTTYIGEFSNFSRRNSATDALGSGTYQLSLNNISEPVIAQLYLPELFTEYKIWLDNKLLDSGSGTANTAFLLTPGAHTLTVNVSAKFGYYAGMYFPGVIGSSSSVLKMLQIKTCVYAAALLVPLILSLFSLGIWSKTRSPLHWRFAMLCLSLAVYLSHYFVQLLNFPFAPWWYLAEDLALYALLYFAVAISADVCGFSNAFSRALQGVAVLLPAAELVLYISTIILPEFAGTAIAMHSALQNGYRIFIFFALLLGVLRIAAAEGAVKHMIIGANLTLGTGILLNLLYSNLFEPIFTLWQFEWSALLMVGVFAIMMVYENQRIIRENALYQTNLQELVDSRTKQLSCLLDERRAFFADMAHDLKAPLNAINTFAQMISRHSVGLDNELLFYIEQVQRKQGEMSRRLQSLNEINAVDKMNSTPQEIDVNQMMNEIYSTHNPEAVVNGIHLVIKVLDCPARLFASREKLLLAFENIIYNALRFTQKDGCICFSAAVKGSCICFKISDTGCGISCEELPHIFERFYMGKAGRQTGSGLGLYIVKNIILEAGGTIEADSVLQKGTTFTICLPVML